MRSSIAVALLLVLTSLSSSPKADETKNRVTPSKVALDFITTVFFDRNADRVAEFCLADAKRHRKLSDGETVAEYLRKTISKLPAGDALQLKHLHVFRPSDVAEEFLKTIMPTVVERDIVASFKPFTDAAKDGFCCIAVFDLVRGSAVRPYMFTFAFCPSEESYKVALMDEGAPR